MFNFFKSNKITAYTNKNLEKDINPDRINNKLAHDYERDNDLGYRGTPLETALRLNADLPIIENLLKAGAQLEPGLKFLASVHTHNTDLIELFIRYGLDLNKFYEFEAGWFSTIPDRGQTLINFLCHSSFSDDENSLAPLIEFIISKGADVNKGNVHNEHPLIAANLSLEVVRTLYRSNRVINNYESQHGLTALFEVIPVSNGGITKERYDVIYELVKNGEDINYISSNGHNVRESIIVEEDFFDDKDFLLFLDSLGLKTKEEFLFSNNDLHLLPGYYHFDNNELHQESFINLVENEMVNELTKGFEIETKQRNNIDEDFQGFLKLKKKFFIMGYVLIYLKDTQFQFYLYSFKELNKWNYKTNDFFELEDYFERLQSNQSTF